MAMENYFEPCEDELLMSGYGYWLLKAATDPDVGEQRIARERMSVIEDELMARGFVWVDREGWVKNGRA
jgi:hypothetical protein